MPAMVLPAYITSVTYTQGSSLIRWPVRSSFKLMVGCVMIILSGQTDDCRYWSFAKLALGILHGHLEVCSPGELAEMYETRER